MKKVFVALIAGLIIIMCASPAYSRDRNRYDKKVTIKTTPKISVGLSALNIKVDFSRDRRLIWIPGYWQHVNHRRGYVWVPGHFEKRAKYYPEGKHLKYCER
ncbi:MAG: YXWGXW repeat-containing protein [Candidatus Omnitrophica bacterium]|jgi:hypothetical protein|nr:YXWGXW repeat-containing protein [Candidatus Omnitrophota bacterium]